MFACAILSVGCIWGRSFLKVVRWTFEVRYGGRKQYGLLVRSLISSSHTNAAIGESIEFRLGHALVVDNLERSKGKALVQKISGRKKALKAETSGVRIVSRVNKSQYTASHPCFRVKVWLQDPQAHRRKLEHVVENERCSIHKKGDLGSTACQPPDRSRQT